MEEEEAACQQFAEQLAEGERQMENLQHSIARNEVDLRQKERQTSDAQDRVDDGIRDLNGQNELLSLGEEHDQYVQALRVRDPKAGSRALSAALLQRKK